MTDEIKIDLKDLANKIKTLEPEQQAQVASVVDKMVQAPAQEVPTAVEVAEVYDQLDQRTQRRISRMIDREQRRMSVGNRNR